MKLINNLKTKFKEWKSGWKEQHLRSGDEFDEEQFIEGNEPFFSDVKKSIKTKIVILLDHSSSIASDAIEYKKATLALVKWNTISAKRLAQVVANGSTPLAEVYSKMFPVLQSRRPDIFLTLTDGEPSDPDAVRNMTKSL